MRASEHSEAAASTLHRTDNIASAVQADPKLLRHQQSALVNDGFRSAPPKSSVLCGAAPAKRVGNSARSISRSGFSAVDSSGDRCQPKPRCKITPSLQSLSVLAIRRLTEQAARGDRRCRLLLRAESHYQIPAWHRLHRAQSPQTDANAPRRVFSGRARLCRRSAY